MISHVSANAIFGIRDFRIRMKKRNVIDEIRLPLLSVVFAVLFFSGCTHISTKEATSAISAVLVYKSAGGRQCEEPVATDANLQKEKERLNKLGISVLAAQCGDNGLVFPAVCGGETGDVWLMTVATSQVMQAQDAGYSQVQASQYMQAQPCRGSASQY